MDTFTSLMDGHQTTLIAEGKRDLEKLSGRIRCKMADVEKIKPKATFYLDLQRIVLHDPDSEAFRAWQTFIMMMKLTLDQPISGLTKE